MEIIYICNQSSTFRQRHDPYRIESTNDAGTIPTSCIASIARHHG